MGPTVMSKLLPPGLNTIDATSVKLAESDTSAVMETPNVAVSVGPLGTVAGTQLVAVFQSPLMGLALQVALPAKECATIKHEKTQRIGKSLFMFQSQQKAAEFSS